ncbi:Distal tail protein [Glutamicibacter phage Montesquieu]|nr:Distal tail protein [Glutamicibacter phage Montesquieu]
MSFTYGGTDTDTLAGVKAALVQWPSMGGLSLETVDKVGNPGRFYAGHSQSHSQFVHIVTIQDETASETRRDNFVALMDPDRGPRDLILETDSQWKFPDVLLAGPIEWDPLVWSPHTGFMWRAQVVMETVGVPYAVEVNPTVKTFATSTSYTLSSGNTSSHPTIEFPSGAKATVTVGGFSVEVAATPAGRTNVLDYQNFDFYQRNSAGVRVASLVRHMSDFDRPKLSLGVATTVSVTGAPAGTRRLLPNARRK